MNAGSCRRRLATGARGTIKLSRTATYAERDLVVVGVARDSRWRSIGAAAGDIARLVAGFALIVSSAGIIIGLTLTFFGTRLIRSMLFGVSPLDPLVYVAAVSTLAAVVALACVGPAWRAIRVPAVEVLRAE